MCFFQSDNAVIGHINEKVDIIKENFYKFNLIHTAKLPKKCQNCSSIDYCNGGCSGLINDRYGTVTGYTVPRCHSR